jgi:hypothetical protein
MIYNVNKLTEHKGDPMKRLVLASAFAVILVMSGTAAAQVEFHSGTITVYHLNSDVPGRGPCIQTEPAAPTTWICVYRTNPLYDELREALRTANTLRQECLFGWSTIDANGYAILSLLECS